MWCMSLWCMSLSLFSWSNNADRLDTPCTRWLGDRCVVRFLRSTSCHLQSWPKVVALKIFIPPWFIISSYRIKIWQLDEASGSWRAQDEWKVNNTHFLAISFEFNPTLQTVDIQAHEAPVSKVSWAHPEFGLIIASCSFDRTAKIWEQVPSSVLLDPQFESSSGGTQPVMRWIERNVMAESKGTVRDVAFAPHYFGLKLVRWWSFDLVKLIWPIPGYHRIRQYSPYLRMHRPNRIYDLAIATGHRRTESSFFIYTDALLSRPNHGSWDPNASALFFLPWRCWRWTRKQLCRPCSSPVPRTCTERCYQFCEW